uniref:MFS domain-containing protein n=1 Tax=Macrostomum lignano TaxID=282301 RepID=A0A1I8FHS4_9PLAT
GLTFGYDLGVIGDALLALRPQFRLTCPEQELIVSALPLGAFAGSLLVSPLMDRYGRRRILRANCALLIGASAALTAAPSLLLLAGRLLLGVGVAVCATGECLYASEAFYSHTPAAIYCYQIGVYCLPYPAYWLCSSWPPSYLLAMGRRPQAEAVLKRLRRDRRRHCRRIAGIERAVRLESGRRVADLIRSDAYGGYRRRFLIGCCLVLLQQLSGQSCAKLHSLPALVDRVGRRRILIAGSAVMAAALAVFSIITAVAEQSFKRRAAASSPLDRGIFDNLSDDQRHLAEFVAATATLLSVCRAAYQCQLWPCGLASNLSEIFAGLSEGQRLWCRRPAQIVEPNRPTSLNDPDREVRGGGGGGISGIGEAAKVACHANGCRWCGSGDWHR